MSPVPSKPITSEMHNLIYVLSAFALLALFAMPAESAGSGALVLGAAVAMLAPMAVKLRDGSEEADGWSAWQVLPLDGSYELVYRDEAGRFSIRRVDAQELRIGPGKILLGGFCEVRGGYRGFRADRIERITDLRSGEAAERNIIDWLLKRADRQARRKPAEAQEASHA